VTVSELEPINYVTAMQCSKILNKYKKKKKKKNDIFSNLKKKLKSNFNAKK